MSPQLKFVISDGKKVLETISKETHDTRPAAMVIAVNDFRQIVNSAITKLIENSDEISDCMEEEECVSADDEEDAEVSPKKRKK